MLEHESIVCFAHDWDSDPTSKTHIMRILAERNRVLWVNSIAMRRPRASRADFGRLAAKLRSGLAGCRQVAPNLHVASPLVIPLPGQWWAEQVNVRVLAAWLGTLIRRLWMSRPIVWTFVPTMAGLVDRLGERLVIYHCVDDYAEFTGVPREAIVRMERRLVRRADVVLASSKRLRDERAEINPNSHYVSHGVDFDHFARARDEATRVPADLAALRRPVVGFFGLIADWVDLRLLADAARLRPDVSFVLIGKVATDVAPLQGAPNVHLLGHRPYDELPAYCRGFDVAVVPFLANELTVKANPLKLREYLAAGLPVVSTPIPEVARYEGLVRTASGATRFVAAIEEALADRVPGRARHRMTAMRHEGWRERVEEMCAIVSATTGGLAAAPGARAAEARR